MTQSEQILISEEATKPEEGLPAPENLPIIIEKPDPDP